MNNYEELLNRKINELLYHFESEEYDKRHPETIIGDKFWWEDFAKKYIKKDFINLKILDIGTGTGLVASALGGYLKERYSFVCYDLCEGMLRQARAKLKRDFYFIQGDAITLPFGNEVFDFVLFNSLLHHLFDYKQFLGECNRVLKKDGILAFAHEPNKKFLESRVCRTLSLLYNLCFPIEITKDLQFKVNAALKEKRLIKDDLSKEEIRRLVEFHSPMEQSRIRIDSTKGFFPQELIRENFYGYSVLELSDYTTYFHRPFFRKTKVISSALQAISKPLFKRGNLFRMVLQK